MRDFQGASEDRRPFEKLSKIKEPSVAFCRPSMTIDRHSMERKTWGNF